MIIDKIAKIIYNMNRGAIDDRIAFLAEQETQRAIKGVQEYTDRVVEHEAEKIFKEYKRSHFCLVGFDTGLDTRIEIHIRKTIEKLYQDERLRMNNELYYTAKNREFLEQMLIKELSKHEEEIFQKIMGKHIEKIVKDVVDKSFKI